ncbi:pitC [Scenedesmus sp. PABB004]|nr:pitC [Scenedesmus sp. PABB004]
MKGDAAALAARLRADGAFDESFCDEACLNRYLRARNGDLDKAAAMVKATLEYRREHRIDELSREEFAGSRFMRDGWVYVDGNDADGRSVVMFRKRRDKLPLAESDEYLRYMTFVIETAIKNMKHGAEQWVWVLDMTVYSPANAPHLSTTLQVLQLLANHYPERLYKAYVVNAPTLFSVAWKVLHPFIDAVTRTKVEFVATRDYHAPAKGAAAPAATWGAWASSMLHAGGGSGSGKGAGAGSGSGVDAAVLVDDGPGAIVAGPGSFGPFVPCFDRPYDYDRHQAFLAACGWR